MMFLVEMWTVYIVHILYAFGMRGEYSSQCEFVRIRRRIWLELE